MIRYLAVLGAFLFMALWFLGGGPQVEEAAPQADASAGALAPERPVFVPAAPQAQPEVVTPVSEPQPAPEITPQAQPQPEPELAGIKLMHVPGGASVRAGPGKQFPVVRDLAAGDVVMVVDDTSAPYWVRIRIDGAGQGWVARSLLRE